MKFAIVEGNRQEATTGIRGTCPGCGSPMIAKCGIKRLRHWAHVSTTPGPADLRCGFYGQGPGKSVVFLEAIATPITVLRHHRMRDR
jgi:hypothetical protein